MQNHASTLAAEFKLDAARVAATVALIDEGNTIPFIARYRKEATGSMDDQTLRALDERLSYLRKLDDQKETVHNSITEQGAMTPEIAAALEKAKTLAEVEDIYRPYKPKRKTRASIARARGLEPLAARLLEQYPDLKGIYVTGTAVKGVCEALVKQEKEREIKVIGNDFLDENKKWVERGAINFLIGQDSYMQGYEPVMMLFHLLFDDEKPESVYRYR